MPQSHLIFRLGSRFRIISLDISVSKIYYTHYSAGPPLGSAGRRMTVSRALSCRRPVEFSAWRAWPFFDIWILSISPFWVARVELAPSPGNLETAVALPQKTQVS